MATAARPISETAAAELELVTSALGRNSSHKSSKGSAASSGPVRRMRVRRTTQTYRTDRGPVDVAGIEVTTGACSKERPGQPIKVIIEHQMHEAPRGEVWCQIRIGDSLNSEVFDMTCEAGDIRALGQALIAASRAAEARGIFTATPTSAS